MARPVLHKLAFAALLACCQPALSNSIPDAVPDVVGEARDPDTGDTIYLEHYYCSDNGLSCSVFYLRPNEELIASKELDYSTNPRAPALTFRDFRLDRQITIDQPDTDAVVDAGFDNFVRLQWQDLAEGEEVKFPFRIVGRDDPIRMRASKDARCADGRLCLQIRLDSWLLGSLVDPIQLEYDAASQRLLRFEGISNLKSDEGRSQKVEIRYRYPEQSARADR